MLRARYATLLRPPAPGAVPREGLVECKAIEGYTPKGHHAWGWVEYDRYLTEDEIKHYDLEYVSQSHPID